MGKPFSYLFGMLIAIVGGTYFFVAYCSECRPAESLTDSAIHKNDEESLSYFQKDEGPDPACPDPYTTLQPTKNQ